MSGRPWHFGVWHRGQSVCQVALGWAGGKGRGFFAQLRPVCIGAGPEE